MTLENRATTYEEQQAELMGYDCGMNGSDLKNCHYTIFAKTEWMRAWERGKARAEADKQLPHQEEKP